MAASTSDRGADESCDCGRRRINCCAIILSSQELERNEGYQVSHNPAPLPITPKPQGRGHREDHRDTNSMVVRFGARQPKF